MRDSVTRIASIASVATVLLAFSRGEAQPPQRAGGPVLRARALAAGAPVKMFIPSGNVELIGWDRDSIEIRGHVPALATLLLSGSDTSGLKLVIEQRDSKLPVASQLTIHLPRRSQLSLKTVDAVVTSTHIGGWFYTVSGSIRLGGSAPSVDAEAMSGDLDLNVSAPWVRARTGKGHLTIRGSPQDVDASTISGTLDVATPAILHGRFTSVTGDIHYSSTPQPRSLFEFTDHSGSVELLLPRDVSTHLELSSFEGDIDNGLAQLRPAASSIRNLRLTLGTGASDITVRTFRGTVQLRAREP
jgi:hypothetical protein